MAATTTDTRASPYPDNLAGSNDLRRQESPDTAHDRCRWLSSTAADSLLRRHMDDRGPGARLVAGSWLAVNAALPHLNRQTACQPGSRRYVVRGDRALRSNKPNLLLTEEET